MAYRIDCVRDDGFMVQSEDENEVMSVIKQHAREHHDMELSDEDARGMMEET